MCCKSGDWKFADLASVILYSQDRGGRTNIYVNRLSLPKDRQVFWRFSGPDRHQPQHIKASGLRGTAAQQGSGKSTLIRCFGLEETTYAGLRE
jgi:hypothetical protein